MDQQSRKPPPTIALLAALVVLLAIPHSSAAASSGEMQSSAQRPSIVGVITTVDFRVVVVAERLSRESPPTAEVRVGFARRVGGRWRELGEKQLRETYFWRTVTGQRAVCRLEIETAGPGGRSRPYVTVRILQSPSLGCGPTYRIPLVSR
jgi:hypothetical protein